MAEEEKKPFTPGCFKSELHARLKDFTYVAEYLTAAHAEAENVFRMAVRDVVEAQTRAGFEAGWDERSTCPEYYPERTAKITWQEAYEQWQRRK